MTLRVACCTAAFLASCWAWQTKSRVKLPEGDGKQLVEQRCTDCHGLETTTGSRLTVEQWQAELDDMIAKGAKVSDSEFQTIVQYLAKHFGLPNASCNSVPDRTSPVPVNRRTPI